LNDIGNQEQTEQTEEKEEKETEEIGLKKDTTEYEKITDDEGDYDKEDDGASTMEEVPKKKRGPRTCITPEQMEVLMAAYLLDRKPSKPKKEQLAEITGLRVRVIQVRWIIY